MDFKFKEFFLVGAVVVSDDTVSGRDPRPCSESQESVTFRISSSTFKSFLFFSLPCSISLFPTVSLSFSFSLHDNLESISVSFWSSEEPNAKQSNYFWYNNQIIFEIRVGIKINGIHFSPMYKSDDEAKHIR